MRQPLRAFAGRVVERRRRAVLVASDVGLQWFRPQRLEELGDGYVRGSGRLVRAPQARAA